MPSWGSIAWGLGLALMAVSPAGAAESVLPEGGLYEVEVRLDLPHLEDTTGRGVARLCLDRGNEAGAYGLAVLSANNPLRACPASQVRRAGDELVFDIACEGRNAARATARYLLAPGSFRGRIAMQMGGKNMTMTEVQAGRRIGPCAGAGAPRP